MSAEMPYPTNQPADPLDVARRVSETMHSADCFARHLGFDIEQSSPGGACVSMTVRPEMANGHAICHGGSIFTLADTALAHASNSRNQISVAVTCQIEFLASAKVGDRLTAIAEQQALAGRNGIFDVRVVNQRDELIALFRGKTRALRGEIVAESGATATG